MPNQPDKLKKHVPFINMSPLVFCFDLMVILECFSEQKFQVEGGQMDEKRQNDRRISIISCKQNQKGGLKLLVKYINIQYAILSSETTINLNSYFQVRRTSTTNLNIKLYQITKIRTVSINVITALNHQKKYYGIYEQFLIFINYLDSYFSFFGKKETIFAFLPGRTFEALSKASSFSIPSLDFNRQLYGRFVLFACLVEQYLNYQTRKQTRLLTLFQLFVSTRLAGPLRL